MNVFGFSNSFSFGLRQLASTQQDLQTSLERLSTGKRVNRASDDPSAIVPINQHKAEIYSLNKELDSIAQRETFMGAKEGGLSVISDLMIQLESLSIQAANKGGNTEDELQAYQDEARSILSAVDQIAQTTTFKGESVLKEYTSAGLDEELREFVNMLADNPAKAQEIAERAREKVSTTRAAIGNTLNEMDSRKNVIGETLINLNASLSSIEDTDYAAETAKLIRSQILESATIKAIEISRESAKQVLGLLENTLQASPTL